MSEERRVGVTLFWLFLISALCSTFSFNVISHWRNQDLAVTLKFYEDEIIRWRAQYGYYFLF